MPEFIEKQHLLDFLDGCIEEEKGNRSQVIVEAIKMTVERMPLGDVIERKHGKWIGGNGVDYVRCGCCHKNYDWVSQAQYYNFCPHCGADMRGRDDERTD